MTTTTTATPTTAVSSSLPSVDDRKSFIGCLAAILAASYDYDKNDNDDDYDDLWFDDLGDTTPTSERASTFLQPKTFNEDSRGKKKNSSSFASATTTTTAATTNSSTYLWGGKAAEEYRIAQKRHCRRRFEILSNLLLTSATLIELDQEVSECFLPMLQKLLDSKRNKSINNAGNDNDTSSDNDHSRRLWKQSISFDSYSEFSIANDNDTNNNNSDKNNNDTTTTTKTDATEVDDTIFSHPHLPKELRHNDLLLPFLENLSQGAGVQCLTLLLTQHLQTSKVGYDSRIRHVIKKLGIAVLLHDMRLSQKNNINDDTTTTANKENADNKDNCIVNNDNTDDKEDGNGIANNDSDKNNDIVISKQDTNKTDASAVTTASTATTTTATAEQDNQTSNNNADTGTDANAVTASTSTTTAEQDNQASDDNNNDSNDTPPTTPQVTTEQMIDQAARKFENLEHGIALRILQYSQSGDMTNKHHHHHHHDSKNKNDNKDGDKDDDNSSYDSDSDDDADRLTMDDIVRGVKIGTVAVLGGTLFAVTGGLAAPGIAAGVGAFLGGAAASATFVTLTGAHVVSTIFGVGGGLLAFQKMSRRTQGLSEFKIRRENDTESLASILLNSKFNPFAKASSKKNNKKNDDIDTDDNNDNNNNATANKKSQPSKNDQNPKYKAELFTTVCLSGWLIRDTDYQQSWGVEPNAPPITDYLELLERFYHLHAPEQLPYCSNILAAWKGKEKELFHSLQEFYGKDPKRLFPLGKGPLIEQKLSSYEEGQLDQLFHDLGYIVMEKATSTSESTKSTNESKNLPGDIMKQIKARWATRNNLNDSNKHNSLTIMDVEDDNDCEKDLNDNQKDRNTAPSTDEAKPNPLDFMNWMSPKGNKKKVVVPKEGGNSSSGMAIPFLDIGVDKEEEEKDNKNEQDVKSESTNSKHDKGESNPNPLDIMNWMSPNKGSKKSVVPKEDIASASALAMPVFDVDEDNGNDNKEKENEKDKSTDHKNEKSETKPNPLDFMNWMSPHKGSKKSVVPKQAIPALDIGIGDEDDKKETEQGDLVDDKNESNDIKATPAAHETETALQESKSEDSNINEGEKNETTTTATIKESAKPSRRRSFMSQFAVNWTSRSNLYNNKTELKIDSTQESDQQQQEEKGSTEYHQEKDDSTTAETNSKTEPVDPALASVEPLSEQQLESYVPPSHLSTVWDYSANYGGELYTITFESQLIKNMCSCVEDFALDMGREATKKILQHTALSTLLSAIVWPSYLAQAANVIDGDWTLAVERTDEAAHELAHSMLYSKAGNRPITLIGYSFGARIIYRCLKVLAKVQEEWHDYQDLVKEAAKKAKENDKNNTRHYHGGSGNRQLDEKFKEMREPASIIEDVILMGVPQHLNRLTWKACRRIVGGRLVNCYSTNDRILSLMYQYKRMTRSIASGLKGGGVCGTRIIDIPGVENVDVSDLIQDHKDYCNMVGTILKRVHHGQPFSSVTENLQVVVATTTTTTDDDVNDDNDNIDDNVGGGKDQELFRDEQPLTDEEINEML